MRDPNRIFWNEQFKILQDTWPKPVNFEACIGIFLNLHAMVHSSEASQSGLYSFEDELWGSLTEEAFRRVREGDQSIAWKLWHTGRIEDITMNLLMAGDGQVMNSGNWLDRLGIKARDTGNAMDEAEIGALSAAINRQALKDYRTEVAKKTRKIVKALAPEDLRRKAEPAGVRRIWEEGAVVEEAAGIVDYWSRKTYAGLLLMPASRHILVHLNESLRLIGKGKPA